VRFSGFNLVNFAPVGQQNFGNPADVLTDAQGVAQIGVRLGGAAGTAYFTVSVPGLGVADVPLTFAITRGGPARVVISPRDTAVAPGGSYTLSVAITDQGGDTIPGLVPTFTATGVSVNASGQVTVPNTVPLREKIIVSYLKASDSAKVSVYPRLPMVYARSHVVNDPRGGGSDVVLINTDGTGSTDLATTSDASLAPSSVAATPRVVYYRGDPTANSKLWVVQPGGTPQLLLSGSTRADAWPRLSPDGTWVYFVRDSSSLWRVRLDGTGLDSLTSFTTLRTYQAPTISPDGRTVAIEDRTGLQIVDVTTKAKSTVGATCAYPSYSPDGASFACTTLGDVSVMRTDGTGRRVLARFAPYEGLEPYSSLSWSPDGKWLLVMFEYQYAGLIEVSSGRVMPLRAAIANVDAQPMLVR
jgi:WD40 repeat protein